MDLYKLSTKIANCCNSQVYTKLNYDLRPCLRHLIPERIRPHQSKLRLLLTYDIFH